MLEVTIPGYRTLVLSFLVLDYNGTIACDGHLIPGVRDRLEELAKTVSIHILTADTLGSVRKEMTDIPCEVVVIEKRIKPRPRPTMSGVWNRRKPSAWEMDETTL
jgi:soluble P-type ATPase